MKYSITYDVESASGSVTYTVDAKSRKEAVKKLKNGKGFISLYEVEPNYSDVDYEKEVFEDPDAEEYKF